MKRGRASYWAHGATAAAVLLAVMALGFVQDRVPSRSNERLVMGKPLTEQQILARRRGAIGTVAVAGATAQ